MSEKKKEPKFKIVFQAADQTSLGISVAVAIILGFLVGYWLAKATGQKWLIAVGIFWGVGAAILNIVKAYKKLKKELDELQNDPKYKNYKPTPEDDEEDEKY